MEKRDIHKKKRKLRRDLIAVSCHLKEGPREDGAKLFSEACSDKTRRNGHDLQQSKFWLGIRESSSAQGGPGTSILGDFHEQRALTLKLSLPEEKVGLYAHRRALPI